MRLPRLPVWIRLFVTRVGRREKAVRLALGLWWRMALAGAWRRTLRRPIFIAVTGSCGKTTTKELLAWFLGERERTICTFRTSNDIWNLCRLLLRSRPSHRYVVAEIATGKPGDVEQAAKVFRPDIAVVLTVRLEHYSAFRTLENVAAEKSALLRYVRPNGTVYLNQDDPYVAAMKAPDGVNVLTFGCAPEADIRGSGVISGWPQRLRFNMTSRHGGGTVETRLLGAHLVTPVLAAAAVGLGLGHPFDDIAAAIGRFPGFPGRMLPVELQGGVTIIRDDYKSTPHAVAAAFDEMQRASAKRKILVFSDVSDTPRSDRERQTRVGRQAAAIFDILLFVGDHASFAANSAVRHGAAEERVRTFRSAIACADFLRTELADGDLVLVKGIGTNHMSRVVFRLAGCTTCDLPRCKKKMLCDACPELGADAAAMALVNSFPALKAESRR